MLICSALAEVSGLSALLMCMAAGAVYVNSSNYAERVLTYVDDWTYPLFILFFVVSGASLDIYALPKVGLLGIVYIFVRFAGKWMGSYIGGYINETIEGCQREYRLCLNAASWCSHWYGNLSVKTITRVWCASTNGYLSCNVDL